MCYNRGYGSSQHIMAALIIGVVVGLIVGIVLGFMISASETHKTPSTINYSYDCNCERNEREQTDCFITTINYWRKEVGYNR